MLLRPSLASLLLLLAVALAAAAPGPPSPRPRVTWAQDVAPLVYRSCAECHHPGGPAPFSLLAYTDARKRAHLMAQVTRSGYMPPWLPEPSSPAFVHARRLSPAQVALFQQWAAAGTPPGDPEGAPPPPVFVRAWPLGKPDQVVTQPRPYLLPAETTSASRAFVLPLALTEDRWLRAIDFRPGNAPVVRHATLYADAAGLSRRLEAQSGAVGYTARDAGLGADAVPLAEWSVGSGPWTLPDGVAERLPAGSDLVLLLRFASDGQPETVRPTVGLYFTPPPQNTPVALTLGAGDLILQPGQKAALTDTFTLPVAARLLRVSPHAHPVCQTLDLTAVPPAGPAQGLLQIRDWNADWQDTYQYAAPPLLPAGTRLSVLWRADNSAANPRNPASPPMTAQPGLQYLDDMAVVRLQLLPADPADAPALESALAASRPPPAVQATQPHQHG